ncbi:hypothetical protein BH11PLA2_BH11PLA2_03050 [soil metagenome]
MTDIGSNNPITHPLQRLRGLIRRYVLIDGLLTAGLFAILWYWIGLAADYGLFKLTHFDWVLDAPKLFRVLVLAALGMLLVGILFTRLFLRLSKELSYTSLALVLEKRFPKILGDKLITAVELSDIEHAKKVGFSESMVRQTIADAQEKIKEVPVSSVFNWRRLKIKGALLALFAIGTLAVVFAGYAAITGKPDVKSFAGGFQDVSGIWAERNLLLRNTPWPRNAHLELLDFDKEELRVGKDATAPKVKARAYKWVMADRNNIHGWRPAMWTDMPTLLGVFTIENFTDDQGQHLPPDAASWDLDRLEAFTGNTPTMKLAFEFLETIASKPSYSRTFRKLNVPDAVTLNYSGPKTSGKVTLTREANNLFTGEVAGLKESVRFTVKGGDFSTTPRSITLVPPPAFSKLARTEYPPAYLYYPAPVVDPTKPPDIVSLKGLRQQLKENPLTLTGDKTVFTIVQGTDFEISGVSDKPLKKVLLRPKIGLLPGGKVGSLEPLEVAPFNTERDSFVVAFKGKDRPATTIEFEIVLVDDDEVTTTRTMLVQVVDDQPPTVELAVSGFIRKQGNAYMVTPIALIPFQFEQGETKVKDDYALWKAEFVYNVGAVESSALISVQAQALAGMIAYAPLMPSIANAYVPAASAVITQQMTKETKKETGTAPVPRFAEQYAGLRKDTLETLKKKLAEPYAGEPQVIKDVGFKNVNLDVFDLRLALPRLSIGADAGEFSQRYRVEFNLVATDANVESGPKTGQNLEPIRLIVVSEAELLSEISKSEETQAGKLDDVLKRLKEALAKLNQTADRLSSPAVPPEIIVSAAVRAQDIAQDVAKSRETVTGVLNAYRDIYKEGEFNRIRTETLNRYQTKIIQPLQNILDRSFANVEQIHGQFQQALGEGRRPEDPVMLQDREAMKSLIDEIERLRAEMGEERDITKLRNDLIQLREKQLAIGKLLKIIKEGLVGKLYLPELVAVPPVELNKGESKSIKQAINWKAYTGGAVKLSITGPGDAVKHPAEVVIPDDKDDVEIKLTAGQMPGEYKLKITPSVGPAIEVIVRVK